MSEDDKIHCFISKLKDKTRSECRYRAPATLFDAIGTAQNFDRSKYDADMHFSKDSGKHRESFQYQTERREATSDSPKSYNTQDQVTPMELGSISGNNIKKQVKFSEKYCSFHKSNGHTDFKCRAQKTVNTRNKSLSTVLQVLPQPADGTTCSETLSSTYLANSNGSSKSLLVLYGLVHNIPANILVDSGASYDHVSQQFVERHNLEYSKTSEKAVALAYGSLIPISGKLEARILIGKFSDTLKLNVIPLSSHDVILGKPWLFRMNPFINWRENSLELIANDVTYVLKSTNGDPMARTLYELVLNIISTDDLQMTIP